MARLIKGDVVVVPFPFSDLSRTNKKRPALVIKDLKGFDLILCQITSKSRSDNYSIPLFQKDFKKGTLNKSKSYIRPNRIFTADVRIIIRSIGRIKKTKMDEVINKLINIITS
ncbi:MAG: type II toxin-antitoxin system PemK/MazF family toxin [Promethearchaeia archaeon]